MIFCAFASIRAAIASSARVLGLGRGKRKRVRRLAREAAHIEHHRLDGR